MNSKLIGLIVLIVLSVVLFLFISYAELKDGFESLAEGSKKTIATGVNSVVNETIKSIKKPLADGITSTMNAIDQII